MYSWFQSNENNPNLITNLAGYFLHVDNVLVFCSKKNMNSVPNIFSLVSAYGFCASLSFGN